MTKAELIDLIYLEASKWKLSKDTNIQRVEIEVMLPLFLSDAIKAFQQETRREQLEELRIFGASAGEMVNQQFVTTLTATPVEDGDYYSITLPKKVMVLPFNRGIKDLRPKSGVSYHRVQSPAEIAGVEGFLTAYWFETIDGVQKLFISNLGMPVCEHYLSVVVDLTDMEDTDEVPLPAGFNGYLLDAVRKYIKGDQSPAESKINYKEDA